MGDKMISVKDLHVRFGDLHVLSGINQEIRQGEKVVVIGPSGSGKSTFLRSLNMLDMPWKGEIIVSGQKINDPKPTSIKSDKKWVWFSSSFTYSLI